MALIKNEMTKYGVEGEYWKMGSFTFDRIKVEGAYTLMLYFNKGAKSYIECKTIPLYGAACFGRIRAILGAGSDIVHACYEDAKKYSEYFRDALDDADYIKEHEEGDGTDDKSEDKPAEDTVGEQS